MPNVALLHEALKEEARNLAKENHALLERIIKSIDSDKLPEKEKAEMAALKARMGQESAGER